MGRWWLLLRSGVRRNPLVRRCDRIEAVIVALAVLLALAAMPLAGVVGSLVHAEVVDTAEEQQASRTQITATLLADAPPMEPRLLITPMVPAAWHWDGRRMVEKVPANPGARQGDRIDIWVDENGHRVPPPLPVPDAAWDAACLALLTWLGVAGLLAGTVVLARRALDRQRYAMWEREWREFGELSSR